MQQQDDPDDHRPSRDEPERTPDTPTDEPKPAPVQDPPAEPNPAPYVVRGGGEGPAQVRFPIY